MKLESNVFLTLGLLVVPFPGSVVELDRSEETPSNSFLQEKIELTSLLGFIFL